MALLFNGQSYSTRSLSFSFATTIVGGPITSNTNWTEANSPYIATSSVLVSEGVTLTVEPGVVVKFDSAKGIQVDGMLVARGTKDKRVVFTSLKDDSIGGDSNGDGSSTLPAPGDWAYLFFTNASVDAEFDPYGTYVNGSVLEYCHVAYGGSLGAQGEINIDSCAPFLNCSTVRNSGSSGIYVSDGSPRIANNTISHNNDRGIDVYDDSIGSGEVTIVGNTVANNRGDGIRTYVPGMTETVSENTVTDSGQRGIYVTGSSYLAMTDNLIRSNSGGGVNYVSVTEALISGNIIINNTCGLYYGYGGGIYTNMGGGQETISNNVIAYNSAPYGGALYVNYYGYYGGALTIFDNSIIANTATADSIVYMYGSSALPVTFQHNLLTQNLDMSNISNSIKVTGFPVVNYNNLFNNLHDYEMNNTNTAGPTHLDATNNWWGTSEEAEIQAKIFDWFDDATKGIVDYSPYDSVARTDVPISPPKNLAINPHGANLTLNWDTNPEPDLAGYRIYYDTDSGYPYAHSVDVGNVTTCTLSGLPANAIFFSVTAYDADADEGNDLFEGHESWYSHEAIADFSPPTLTTPSRIPDGEVQYYQPVRVLVNATDAQSGVKNVTLLYTVDNGTTWQNQTMYLNASINLYECTIPGQSYGTWVRFTISAFDYAGNKVVSGGTDPSHMYQILSMISEFPSQIMMPLLVVAGSLALMVCKRRRRPSRGKTSEMITAYVSTKKG